ncbi:hypothetical protein GCM10022251_35250 [Phytohabitans flavus]|uniref:DUF2690 domain-containing protein n=1 Tax=Phytohabitans flavus TaxID=1076124 RepID=A0A6F8XMW8_9ACTN|nr:DUF2690 domain-containing protein [Phytohabitans flavus]BCB75111.1 hypothetical protein Pflav_015210 [Phytohabitans flavus]
MYSRLKAALGVLALSAMATTATIVGSATPAQAAVCNWITPGDQSNCDNVDPDVLGPSCGNDARSVYTVRMRNIHTGRVDGPYVDLRYSPNCRTVWGRIRAAWGPDQDQFGCSVTIHRNSDGENLSKQVPYGATNATVWTNVLYDANVSSLVFAACDTGVGTRYEGITPNY